MTKFLKTKWQLLSICLVSLVIFFPSLFVFYTNDDFFFLKISNVKSLSGFINFFNIIHGPDGFEMYRPLTTQVFYFIGERMFNFNPIWLHIISFVFFFGILFLIYKLSLALFSKQVALPAVFLYAVSATHFGQLYYLAAFQELGMTFFVLLTCLLFLRNKYFLSFVFFVLALMSKETAVVIPVLLVLIYFLQRFSGCKVLSFKKLMVYLSPFVACLVVYLFIRIFSYGFATGDSYIWDFSIKKFVNTVMWYILWSLNIPESIVDFVGPGLHFNPNLFKFWSDQVIPVFILVISQCLILVWMYFKVLAQKAKEKVTKVDYISIFCIAWFAITLLPVVFLPIHKFTFYLTLPLIGLVVRIGYLFAQSKSGKVIEWIFLILWTATSLITLRFTVQTNWITQSEDVSERVFQYFNKNKPNLASKNINFIDTSKDATLPWSPTATVKTALSDKNFFDIFYPNLSARVSYVGLTKNTNSSNTLFIESRQFLGY